MGDRKLFSKIFPLTKMELINEIHIIRDKVGIKNDKIIYHVPYVKILFLKEINKLLLSLYIGLKINPKVVIGYYFLPHGIIAYITGKVLRIKVIISILGSDLYGGGLKYYSSIFFPILKRTDGIMVRGNSSKKILVENNINKNKIFVVHNYIDLQRFIVKKQEKKYDLIYVGVLRKLKRVERIIDITYNLKKIKKEIKLIILGRGSEYEELKNKVEKLNLINNVNFTGFVKNPEAFLQQSKIFVMASTHEGLPAALIEAMASGLPSVVPDVGDISDIIEDKINSFLIENDSGYEEVITNLLDDRNLYNRISNEAQKIKEMFNIENIQAQWMELLQYTNVL
jgi:glycosyltransferase involved in cell wall biosynthesis